MRTVSPLTIESLSLEAGIAIMVALVLNWQSVARHSQYLRWAALSWWMLAAHLSATGLALRYAVNRPVTLFWDVTTVVALASAGLHALFLIISARALQQRTPPQRRVIWLVSVACVLYGLVGAWYPEAGLAGRPARQLLRVSFPALGLAVAYLSLVPSLWRSARPGEPGARLLLSALTANAALFAAQGGLALAATLGLAGLPDLASLYPVAVLAQAMFGVGWTGVILETEQRTREAAAYRADRADKMLRDALDASDDVMGVVDQMERLVLFNTRMSRVVEDVTGAPPVPMMPYPRPRRPEHAGMQFVSSIQRALRGERVTERSEILTMAGRRLVLDRHIVPIREAGVVTGAFVVARDVTDDEALRREAERSMRIEAMARMAGGLAHDFNNILTVVQTNLQLLSESGEHDAESMDIIMETAAALDRANQLTRRLLSVARERPAAPARVDVGALLRDFSRFLQHAIGEEVVLSLDLPSDEAPVFIDPGRLEQVLLNLALNGRDAMPRGGGLCIRVIREHLPASEAGAHAKLPGDTVSISVADEGIGMDDETLRRAGDPFFTTKHTTVGSGLGLATCRAIITEAGGTLDIASAPDQGTTVTIRLRAA